MWDANGEAQQGGEDFCWLIHSATCCRVPHPGAKGNPLVFQKIEKETAEAVFMLTVQYVKFDENKYFTNVQICLILYPL